jgi:hypothetical protein
MKRLFAIIACALGLPGTVLAATQAYETSSFETVSVSSGIDVDISIGPDRSVVANTASDTFDDLKVLVEGNELKIGRPASKWFNSWTGNRPHYKVTVIAPALRSLDTSSGSDVTVTGELVGDFSVEASSGSDVKVSGLKAGNVKVRASSGSDVELEGSCVSLDTDTSSGSDVDAGKLRCENVKVDSSSGSDVSVTATKQVTGRASSSSDVSVRGKPAVVNVNESSGADVTVTE